MYVEDGHLRFFNNEIVGGSDQIARRGRGGSPVSPIPANGTRCATTPSLIITVPPGGAWNLPGGTEGGGSPSDPQDYATKVNAEKQIGA